jgi:GTP-dependent phosphoenolpyruvate carboxykinase
MGVFYTGNGILAKMCGSVKFRIAQGDREPWLM